MDCRGQTWPLLPVEHKARLRRCVLPRVRHSARLSINEPRWQLTFSAPQAAVTAGKTKTPISHLLKTTQSKQRSYTLEEIYAAGKIHDKTAKSDICTVLHISVLQRRGQTLALLTADTITSSEWAAFEDCPLNEHGQSPKNALWKSPPKW